MTNPIDKACEVVGGQSKLARELGITPSAVSQMRKGSRPVPPDKCVAIEQITEGAVTRKDLRPDDWQSLWPELDDRRTGKDRRSDRRKNS